jgi:[NiFe] hydrogenase diaphorase moiety large subunit
MAGANTAIVNEVAGQFGNDRTRLMDVARAVHARLGYLSEDTVADMATALGTHRVEVRDMVSFYTFLPMEKRGKYTIHLCNALVERMKGADEVARAFEEATGVKVGETTPCGTITLAHTACMGLSDQAPGALVNGVPLANLSPAEVPAIVKALRDGQDPKTLPQAKVDLNLRMVGDVVFAPMDRGKALRKALGMTPEEVITEMNKARVRGRGGAGFPMAMKWDFCRKAKGDAHYLICNADEGEPGTFKDRVILKENPDLVFEGMTIAAYAIGATEGFLYLRGEYDYLRPELEQVLSRRRSLGLLGKNVCGQEGFDFDIRIQMGAGAYICGEESALINSLEGKRGAPRDRPPFPVQSGYMNQPTSVNNVETLCCAARIMEKGAEWFSKIGTKDSTGTKVLSISGDCERPGVYEVPYGFTIESMLEMVGAPEAIAVQVGGPSGSLLAPKDFGRCISFEDLPTGGSIIIFGPGRDLLGCMREFLEFFIEESCGWCTPCRVGTTLLLELFDKVRDGKATQADLDQLKRLANTVKVTSRCGLGQTAPNPIMTSMKNFPGLYESRLVEDEGFVPSFDLAAAMAEGCAATGRKPHAEGEHA